MPAGLLLAWTVRLAFLLMGLRPGATAAGGGSVPAARPPLGWRTESSAASPAARGTSEPAQETSSSTNLALSRVGGGSRPMKTSRGVHTDLYPGFRRGVCPESFPSPVERLLRYRRRSSSTWTTRSSTTHSPAVDLSHGFAEPNPASGDPGWKTSGESTCACSIKCSPTYPSAD